MGLNVPKSFAGNGVEVKETEKPKVVLQLCEDMKQKAIDFLTQFCSINDNKRNLEIRIQKCSYAVMPVGYFGADIIADLAKNLPAPVFDRLITKVGSSYAISFLAAVNFYNEGNWVSTLDSRSRCELKFTEIKPGEFRSEPIYEKPFLPGSDKVQYPPDIRKKVFEQLRQDIDEKILDSFGAYTNTTKNEPTTLSSAELHRQLSQMVPTRLRGDELKPLPKKLKKKKNKSNQESIMDITKKFVT